MHLRVFKYLINPRKAKKLYLDKFSTFLPIENGLKLIYQPKSYILSCATAIVFYLFLDLCIIAFLQKIVNETTYLKL